MSLEMNRQKRIAERSVSGGGGGVGGDRLKEAVLPPSIYTAFSKLFPLFLPSFSLS